MVSAHPGDKEHTLELSAEIERAERQLESATIRRTDYFRRKTRQEDSAAEVDPMNERIWRLERELATAVGTQAREMRREGAGALTASLADVRGRSRRCEHWLTVVARDSLAAVLAASPGRTANPLPTPRLGRR
jgi:hypothetical protein